MNYSLKVIRLKAYNINLRVEKGFVHFRDVVDLDSNDCRRSGFMVEDLATGFYVKGCYDDNFDHLWDLNDVVEYLKEQYEFLGLDW